MHNVTDEQMQDYISLVNVLGCFVDITPEHTMYESIRRDVCYYLNKIKGHTHD